MESLGERGNIKVVSVRQINMCEFYNTPKGSVMVSNNDEVSQFSISDFSLTESLFEAIKNDYPKAFQALQELYKESALNRHFYKFRIVHRWLRCNCGSYDTMREDYVNGVLHPEQVTCPLRGECELEGIVCMCRLTLTARQQEITSLIADGLSAQQIAVRLGVSVSTVNNTIQRIKEKLGVKKTVQIVEWYLNQ